MPVSRAGLRKRGAGAPRTSPIRHSSERRVTATHHLTVEPERRGRDGYGTGGTYDDPALRDALSAVATEHLEMEKHHASLVRQLVRRVETVAPSNRSGRSNPRSMLAAVDKILSAVDRPVGRRARAMARRHADWRPSVASLTMFFIVVLFVTGWFALPYHGVLGWPVSIIWTWPVVTTVVGIYGVFRARRHLKKVHPPTDVPGRVVCRDLLIVVVPTIGRNDTYPALERSVTSYVRYFSECFPNMRVDIVTEEQAEARERIAILAACCPNVRVVVVPRSYQTCGGTRFKARANHYAHELRMGEGEARDDVWIMHMDDDTGIGLDTSIATARFIEEQRQAGPAAKHLAQGILTYPREHAVNYITWLADALRPADDFSRFCTFTGGGTPLCGVHGELLLIRASVEASIGWDFGPDAIVEDAQLALNFCVKYSGRSGWLEGRCYGASPATIKDFVKQRERWAWGLLTLVCESSIPLRLRVFIAYALTSWVIGPLQNTIVILLVGAVLGDLNTSPVSLYLLPIWALNLAYVIWMYWEGLKVNSSVSTYGRRKVWEPPLLLLLIPLLSLLEGIGGFMGLVRFLRREKNEFVVIAKPE